MASVAYDSPHLQRMTVSLGTLLTNSLAQPTASCALDSVGETRYQEALALSHTSAMLAPEWTGSQPDSFVPRMLVISSQTCLSRKPGD